MLIRPATLADVLNMMAIERQSATAAHWTERDYTRIFTEASPRRLALVLECGGDDLIPFREAHESSREGVFHDVCAFIVARCFDREWEIENIVVADAVRGRGLGTKLLGAFLDRVRDEGASEVSLEVRESNVSARKLYAKWNFVEVGHRKSYYSKPLEDAVLLRCKFRKAACENG
ncbi:MAG TPA: GNAT family N-acetyltransferase [Clostridia bacterium]|nr:GNAT family N-acetyltransferase [Clostridia bacterium]